MKAQLKFLERFERRKGYMNDNRKRGMYAVVSYFCAGVEFRRGYWFEDGTSENGIMQKIPHEIEVTL